MSGLLEKSKDIAKKLKNDTKNYSSTYKMNIEDTNDKISNFIKSSKNIKTKFTLSNGNGNAYNTKTTSRSSSVTSIVSISSNSIIDNIKDTTSRISFKRRPSSKPEVDRSTKNGLTTITSIDSTYESGFHNNDSDTYYSDSISDIEDNNYTTTIYKDKNDNHKLQNDKFNLRVIPEPFDSCRSPQFKNVFNTPLSDVFSDTNAV